MTKCPTCRLVHERGIFLSPLAVSFLLFFTMKSGILEGTKPCSTHAQSDFVLRRKTVSRGMRRGGAQIKTSPDSFESGLVYLLTWRRPIFPGPYALVSSALVGLTSVFGMGTGGPPPVWSPGNLFSKSEVRYSNF